MHPGVVGKVERARTASTGGMLPDRAMYVARSARYRAGGDGAARRPYRQLREAPAIWPAEGGGNGDCMFLRRRDNWGRLI